MTLQIVAKRACPQEIDGPALKRWKPSQPMWAGEGVAPPPPQASVKVEEVQEPTSVLDLQTSPGRSCSSSGSLSSHASLSSDETIHGVDNVSASMDESVHNDHDIASWMECMEDPNGPLALADFAKCDEDVDEADHRDTVEPEVVTKLEVEGIDHFVNADIDFGFELSLSGDDDHGAFSMSAMLADDPGLCLMEEPKFLHCFPDGFHDAHRLLDLDDSLSSMMNSHGIGVGEAVMQTSGTSSEHNDLGTTSEPPLDSGLQLVHLLLACAEAIDEADFDIARPMLSRLKAISNPYGDPMQRIALYFADALSNRLAVETVESSSLSPSDLTSRELAFQSFYEVLPFSKFTHFTANQAIFEAVGYRNKIHIVDLDVQQGLQWPSLLQTLSMRPGGPPHLKITAVGTNAAGLELTKRRLTEFAQSLEVPFEFAIVAEDLTSLNKDTLHLASDEALAVNCSQVLHGLTGNEAALEKLLSLIRSLNPEVVTLLEVEANHNGANLMSRFVEALHYYCALFDALEGSLGRDSPDRFLIENTTLFAEIKGIVAALEGGHARHVKSETWQNWFTKCGFRSKPLSTYAVQQAQLLLAYFVTGDATPYKLSEECGALIMGWQDTPVMAVSSWSCC
ncbi:hypothetical protein M758_8G014100 [Ceratodon purpureus]|uniref:Uncharacterized protein n=1 Tax=Ceratodon purpureus TaxID=3225 RepID=A0A8T0GYB6_CERPU|nr:hypothetical protein KC19_8G014800 [Ceratodon purpureus]KAG0607259.1 hypothetical protein M758_8G014100 [Ceratodon purpureus]